MPIESVPHPYAITHIRITHIWHFLTSCDPWAPYDKAPFPVMGIDAWQIQLSLPVNKNCLEGIWCRVISIGVEYLARLITLHTRCVEY